MIIQSKKVWLADQFVPAQIEITDGRITGVYPYGSGQADRDYGSERILPGFIDVHCHGAYGFDTNDAEEEGLRNWVRNIVGEGVTALLPTTITQSEQVLTAALKNVAKVVADGYEGAEILGVHFEGPYLDMVYKGAQPEQYIVKPTVEQFKKYQEAANGLIRYITMATETDEDFALTRYCSEHGVVVSIGHSAATYEQAVMAFAYGARSMTHVYNGMTPFNHRANGLVGAAYRIRSMYGECICDGNHSTYAALNQFFHEKGADHAILVTDALMAKGKPVGSRRQRDRDLSGRQRASDLDRRSGGLDAACQRRPAHPDRGSACAGERGDQRLHEEPGGLPADRGQEGRDPGWAGCGSGRA